MTKKRKAASKNDTDASGAAAIACVGAGKGHGKSSRAAATFRSFPYERLLNLKLPPAHDRRLEVLNDGTLWVVRNFMTAKECASWIDFCESSGALAYQQQPGTKYMAHRECYQMRQLGATDLAAALFRRLQDDNSPGVLAALEAQLEGTFPSPEYRPVGFNPNIRVYKYAKGHAFGKHVDDSDVVPGMGRTEITILVYLSSCDGGATRFWVPQRRKDDTIAFEPQVGTMLLHIHGDRCLEHSADAVTGGTKYVLRTDMVFDKKGEQDGPVLPATFAW